MRLELPEVERRARAVLAARPGVRFGLLFGSAVTKGTERARDLDVAVGFVGSPSLMELARLSDDLEAAVGMPVDVVDVETATTLLRWEIVRTGRMIHGRAEAAALEFLARVPVEWSDVQPYREREVAGLRRRLEEGRWSDPTS